MPPRETPRSQFPTIASMRGHGVKGFHVHCLTYGCGRQALFSFDELKLPEAMVFLDIAKMRFVCSKCENRRFEISVDWRDHNAPGMGRPNAPG